MALKTSSILLKKSQCIALLGPILIPALHILVLEKYWSDFTVNVSKEHCTCSCWDTVFKGICNIGKYIYMKHSLKIIFF